MPRQMKHSFFQRLAFYSLVSLLVLIVVGAVVRVTGAGMGCPDWPKCWGKFIPPISVDQVDIHALVKNQSFIREYQHQVGSGELTPEALRSMFNPVHTWTEYINRLFSLPIGFCTLFLFIYATRYKARNPTLFWGSFMALFLVIVNAVMGAMVVATGLKPGVITLHMALAMLLVCILVYLIWKGAKRPKKYQFKQRSGIVKLGFVLFLSIVIEGIMGSQVRELTDQLQRIHEHELRPQWQGQLEQTWVYILHRSFSWVILILTGSFYSMARKYKSVSWEEYLIVGIVLAQMCLGIILSHVSIFAIAQVLHISLSSLLIAVLFYWILCGYRKVNLNVGRGREVSEQ